MPEVPNFADWFTKMKAEDVITVDKDILGGVPVFKGTRVPVKNLFDYLTAGDSLKDFLNDFDYIPKASCIFILKSAGNLFIDCLSVAKTSSARKSSDFRGMLNLTDEQYDDFQTHFKSIRTEWR